jgi:penicillin amidase
MKILKNILSIISVSVIVMIIAGIIIVSGIRKSGDPVYDGQLTVAGLRSEVTVYRDERGMPHIYAADEHDLYFAVGYVMAQERLWQMDLIRRATKGRLSEIFGHEYEQTDLFLRSLDMTTKSKLVIRNEDPLIISWMQAYADGVNEFIGEAGKNLSPEFRILGYRPEKWELEDIANIIGYMGWDLASLNLTSDIFYHRLAVKLGPEKAALLIPDWKDVDNYVFPGFRLSDSLLEKASTFISSADRLGPLGIVSFSGSNNWAVSGSKTTTGKPVLSNDMHLSFGAPGIWFEIHEVVPGKLNVTGVAVPGQPFIVAGHNQKIAWGMTNLMVDDIDLFAETINPDNPGQYLFNGEWREMKIKKEIIGIKGGRHDTLELKFTHRGPVISGLKDVKDLALSMRWSGYDSSDEIRSVALLDRASDWNDFRSAVSTFRSISQNFVYADTEGNIGINTGGGIPIRKGPGTIIRDGRTDEYDWKGYVPFNQLPFIYNPSEGYVSSANNRTVDDNYPYYISSNFCLPYRIIRIRQMLNEKKILGPDDFKKMILDQHSAYAAMLTPFILRLDKRKNELTAQGIRMLDTLRKWDYNMDADKTASTVFEFFRMSFAKNLLEDELGDLYQKDMGVARDYYIYRIMKTGPDMFVDDITTPEKETLDDIVLRSYNECLAALSEKYGDEPTRWKWGDIHKFTIEHPLGSIKILELLFRFNSPTFRVGGSDHTVSPYSYGSGFRVNHGASERHIFNTSDWDESLTIIPTGESGVLSSEFYLSQMKDYINGRFYKDAFSDEAVKKAAKYRLSLVPVSE